MESLPTEILDHVFNQFPNRCEICQQKCLRALPTQEFSKCSNTCKRWNGWIEKKIRKIGVLKKCYSDFEDLISVTLNIQQEKKFGIRLWIHRIDGPIQSPNSTPVPIIHSIIKNGPVGRDGRIKIGDSILQVNEISFDDGMDLGDISNVLIDALKLQCVQLVVGQEVARPIRDITRDGGGIIIL